LAAGGRYGRHHDLWLAAGGLGVKFAGRFMDATTTNGWRPEAVMDAITTYGWPGLDDLWTVIYERRAQNINEIWRPPEAHDLFAKGEDGGGGWPPEAPDL
jgi:hypothetical protein